DVPHALLPPAPGGPIGDVLPVELHRAPLEGLEADDRLDQLRLPVALHAGDADDLTGVDVEGHVLHHGPAGAAGYGEAPHGEHDATGHGALAGLGGGQVAAHHELGEVAGGDVLRRDGRDGGAGPDDGDAVRHLQDLVELVRDEQDGDALLLQLGQVGE